MNVHGNNILEMEHLLLCHKSNQGNQDSSGNQKNAIQGQKPDRENSHTTKNIK